LAILATVPRGIGVSPSSNSRTRALRFTREMPSTLPTRTPAIRTAALSSRPATLSKTATIVRSGPLAIAISTAGASPALAKRMKREVADLFGEEYARLAVILNDARGWAKGTLPTYQDRKEFFEGIVNGEPDPVVLIREGREAAVLAMIENAKETAATTIA